MKAWVVNCGIKSSKFQTTVAILCDPKENRFKGFLLDWAITTLGIYCATLLSNHVQKVVIGVGWENQNHPYA